MQNFSTAISSIDSLLERIVTSIGSMKTSIETANSASADSLEIQTQSQAQFLIMLLEQQAQMIEKLSSKYGQVFFEKCSYEVDEIACVAEEVHGLISTSFARGRETVDSDPNSMMSLIQMTPRLNILQQRIAGKMMKVK